MTQSEYLEIVKEQIRQKQMQEELAEELGCHIEDQAEVYRSLGYPVEKAMEKAVEDMGDPVETGVQAGPGTSAKAGQQASGYISFYLVHRRTSALYRLVYGKLRGCQNLGCEQNYSIFHDSPCSVYQSQKNL